MNFTESIIQRDIVNAVRLKYPKAIIAAIPNGGSRSAKTGAMLKREGVMAGFADLIFIYKQQIIFFEVKSVKGYQSDLQREFQHRVEENGFPYYVVRSSQEILQIINGKF